MTSALDRAHAALQDGEETEGMAFYRALADAELFLVLETEARGEVMSPRVFELSDGPLLLVFDTEERLAGFDTRPVPYAALPGRVIAAQMAGQGLALGVNLGTGAASEMILPPDATEWLVQMLDQRPAEQVLAQVVRYEPPAVPDAVLNVLAGMAVFGGGCLAGVVYASGRRGVMLALTGVQPDDEARVARAVTEALAFSGFEASELDLAFVAAGDAGLARMAEVGLICQPQIRPAPVVEAPMTPGSDPLRPPILR